MKENQELKIYCQEIYQKKLKKIVKINYQISNNKIFDEPSWNDKGISIKNLETVRY